MAFSQEYIDFVMDQLSGLEDVTFRSMFGGAGIYSRGVIFALVAEDVFYMKETDSNRAFFESRGMNRFKPYPDKERYMGYFRVPEDVLESSDELCSLAALTLTDL